MTTLMQLQVYDDSADGLEGEMKMDVEDARAWLAQLNAVSSTAAQHHGRASCLKPATALAHRDGGRCHRDRGNLLSQVNAAKSKPPPSPHAYLPCHRRWSGRTPTSSGPTCVLQPASAGENRRCVRRPHHCGLSGQQALGLGCRKGEAHGSRGSRGPSLHQAPCLWHAP